MKLLKMIMVVLAIISAGVILESKVQAQAAVSFQVFYDDLSPYGRWVADPDFGYVWMPAAEAGFSPYSTGGHWVWTNLGWTWVSDYPWGWAPFHYGRWRYNDFYGWQWVPGNEWGPAWVSWRRARGYYGWAPLSPGISVSVAIGAHYNIPHERWVFVNEKYIGDPHVSHYYAPHNNNVTIINNSTVINNTYVDNSRHSTYIAGPGRDEVQKVTGKPVNAVAIKESGKPGQSVNDKELSIYRPAVKNNDIKGADKPAPRTVTEMKDVKTVNGKQPPVSNDEKGNAKANDQQNSGQDKQHDGVTPDDHNNNDVKGNDEQSKKPGNVGKVKGEDKREPDVKKNPHPPKQNHNNKGSEPPKPKEHKE